MNNTEVDVEELLYEINHDVELIESNKFIEKLKKEVKFTMMSDETHDYLYEKIMRVLDHLGTLSSMCFIYTDQLEDVFYAKTILPIDGEETKDHRTLWLECTGDVHKKYDQQKNKCFKLIDALDLKYYSKFKSEPPNWRYSNDMSALLDYKSYMKNNNKY